ERAASRLVAAGAEEVLGRFAQVQHDAVGVEPDHAGGKAVEQIADGGAAGTRNNGAGIGRHVTPPRGATLRTARPNGSVRLGWRLERGTDGARRHGRRLLDVEHARRAADLLVA